MAKRTGETEFGGKSGMVIVPEQVGHETGEQSMWEAYATNPASTVDVDPEAIGRVRTDAIPGAMRPGTVGEGGTK